MSNSSDTRSSRTTTSPALVGVDDYAGSRRRREPELSANGRRRERRRKQTRPGSTVARGSFEVLQDVGRRPGLAK